DVIAVSGWRYVETVRVEIGDFRQIVDEMYPDRLTRSRLQSRCRIHPFEHASDLGLAIHRHLGPGCMQGGFQHAINAFPHFGLNQVLPESADIARTGQLWNRWWLRHWRGIVRVVLSRCPTQ